MKASRAVITADMVNSTQFSREESTAWLEELLAILHQNQVFKWALKPEIYRGDSFQAVLRNPDEAMRMAVLARACMRKHAPNADMRVAIGIGHTEQLTDRPGTSDGEAFRLSGHLADTIRQQKSEDRYCTSQAIGAIIGNTGFARNGHRKLDGGSKPGY